jgi:hypothetical protein
MIVSLNVSTYIYDEQRGKYTPIEKYKSQLDSSDYIDGYIKIKIGKLTLCDKELFDDIDYLWPYWMNGLKNISNNKDFKGYYPDQPVKMGITIVDKNIVKVCVEERCAKINKNQFIKSMASNAIIFFEKLRKIFPNEAYIWQQHIHDTEKILKKCSLKIVKQGD